VRRFPRYPGTLALALVLAGAVWYGKAQERRERISERQLDASVTLLNVPADMVITSDVPRVLLLRVRGPLSRLRSLDPAQIGVVVDLRGAGEGEHDFAVEARSATVPPDVSVIAVSPSQLPLRLERVVQRRIPVRPRVAGEPAAGLAVGEVETVPAAVLVSGPRLQLEALRGVTTDAISVDGAEGPIEAVVAVRSPQPLVRIVEPLVVRARVEIVAAPPPGVRKRR
jgi:YbbR domain-containing protein